MLFRSTARGLPTIPLVPVSSSQAVIGAVVGIAVAKGGRGVRYAVLGRVAGGWVVTPVIAAVLAFLGLFFLQNVFGLVVARQVPFEISEVVLERLSEEGVADLSLERMKGTRCENARAFRAALVASTDLTGDELDVVMEFSERDSFFIEPKLIPRLESSALSEEQVEAVRDLSWRSFAHGWRLHERLARRTEEWEILPDEPESRDHNEAVRNGLRLVFDTFRVPLSTGT